MEGVKVSFQTEFKCLSQRELARCPSSSSEVVRLYRLHIGLNSESFQGFALRIECLLGRWRNRNISSLGKNQAEHLQDIRSPQPALLRRFQLFEQVLDRFWSDRHAKTHAEDSP
jgi:hypothetical protein